MSYRIYQENCEGHKTFWYYFEPEVKLWLQVFICGTQDPCRLWGENAFFIDLVTIYSFLLIIIFCTKMMLWLVTRGAFGYGFLFLLLLYSEPWKAGTRMGGNTMETGS